MGIGVGRVQIRRRQERERFRTSGPVFRWDSCRDAHPVRQRRAIRSQTVGRWHTGCAKGGMSPTEKQAQLPHHKLIAYQLALELVQLVARTRIGEAQLRAQARKSAASAAPTKPTLQAEISSAGP